MNHPIKKSLKQVAALALAAALALGTTACGSSTTSNGSAAGSAASAAKSATKTTKVDTTSKLAKSVDLKVKKDGTVSFTDDLGNAVTVKDPQHVVACMGSFANAWELAGGTLTAATDDAYENYGVDSSKVASVGRSTSLSLESILAQDPDFVIMTGTSDGKHSTGVSQSELKSSLDASGVSGAFFKVTTFSDYLRMLRVFTAWAASPTPGSSRAVPSPPQPTTRTRTTASTAPRSPRWAAPPRFRSSRSWRRTPTS